MDTCNVLQHAGGGEGQVGSMFTMALMGALLNFVTDFSLKDQREDELKAKHETKDQFDFIVGNYYMQSSTLNHYSV